ncbi:MAG TPA: pyridoxamine 5'-phosphate oxidase [Puia sp.]|jgi:pyridoxamine 5'-phosphate oxidase|nr:pyridoxamine 5'-phosphate oxidase [Puia sp.]
MNSLADMRKDYQLQKLSEESVNENPFLQFNTWWSEAVEAKIDEVNAMTLATASGDGAPAARTVLLKAFDESGFVFFSNYDSNKGKQLQENPRACLVFFWKELERQIRITGTVSKTSGKESDEYFNSRPEGSRIGAWASPQSHIIASRKWLEENEKEFRKKFNNEKLSRPENWGGYRVMPAVIEFWQGRPNRLHDRIQYTFQENSKWVIERLAP